MRRITMWAAAAVIGLGGGLALAGPAQADTGHYPAAGWLVQDTAIGPDVDWSDCDPGPVRVGSVLSSIVDASTVELVGTGVAAPPHYGTSIETPDLGLDVSVGDTISVDYELVDGASAAAGAIRLFIYSAPSSDTDCTPPAQFVVAPDGPTSETLTITVDFDGTIGTAGLVYDSSNSGVGGLVRFSGLVVGDTPVRFTPPEPVFSTDCEAYVNSDSWCEEVEVVNGLHDVDRYNCPDAAKGPYAPPNVKLVDPDVDPFGLDGLPGPSFTGEPGVGCEVDTASPSPEVSESPAPGSAGGMDDAGGQLPVTGSSLPVIIGIGAGLLGVGVGLFFLARRRRGRYHFTA